MFHVFHNATCHFILAEVSRLFGPYQQGGRRLSSRRSLAVPGPRHLSSYTHIYCCFDNINMDLVPPRHVKERLASEGLGKKRLTFQGMWPRPYLYFHIMGLTYVSVFMAASVSNKLHKAGLALFTLNISSEGSCRG